MDMLELHRRAGQATRSFVAGVQPDQSAKPTNCDMDVRGLLNHIISGHLWAVELVQGKTIAEVGDHWMATCWVATRWRPTMPGWQPRSVRPTRCAGATVPPLLR